jgi:predicted component of type VI protein secretion system
MSRRPLREVLHLALERRLRRDAPSLVAPDAAPGARVLLGRSRRCDVRFVEPSVSRLHAELLRVDGGWLLVDRHSTRGTFVNGRRISSAVVADGDEIRLGEARMILRA